MKLSIIIPVYNTEKYIKQCIESVTAIKDIETEIIVVNDGSTDSSKDILEEYTEKNDRIKVITQKNQGASAARNTGIKASTGDYIYFLDSDDWIDTVSFEKIIKELENDYKNGEKIDIYRKHFIFIGLSACWKINTVICKEFSAIQIYRKPYIPEFSPD